MENLQGGTLALEHHYHLDERISSFGLVTLYAGTQDPFDLPVLITLYGGLADAGADEKVTSRIKASAQAASAVDGEGLLAVIDFGEIEQGVPFIVEETVAGPSLRNLMEARGVFSPREVAELLGRLSTILNSAHKTGICHGNLTPEWILIPGDGSPLGDARICHFGLTPSMAELVAMPQAVLTTDLVDAFPPESFDVAARDQIEDEQSTSPHLTPEADQWALGALAYRLLVGVHPFFDDPVDASEGILRIKTEQPPPLSEMGIDKELAEVIDRALRPDPQNRWPDIAAFGCALARAVEGPSTSSSNISPPDADNDEYDSVEQQGSPDSDSPPAEATGPRPSGYLVTVALAALVLSNLGWVFFTLGDEELDGEESAREDVATASAPDALPSGLQITTIPADAELFVVDGESEEPLGTTPHVITDSLLVEAAGLELMLRRAGYRDQYLVLEETEAGQNIEINLITENSEPLEIGDDRP